MRRGFTLIETIIAIAIFLIVIVGIVGVLQANIRMAGRTGARVGAVSLANQRMEILRNLNYNDVGTIGGIPAGQIPQEKTINLNSIEYTLKTFIQYFDDPTDGIGVSDENRITADYKKARIEVSWSGSPSGEASRYAAAPVVAVSDFMPKSIETVIGGGTLSINIFDAQVQPVSLANVHIINNEVEPNININVQTNEQGKIIFPGSPSIGHYQIIVTKNGYSSAQTYDITSENPNPDPGHLTILEGQITEANFFIDKVSSLVVETFTDTFLPLANVSFKMTGAKIIGKDSQGQLIYKYSQNHQTNISGYLNISNLEWDIYDISSTKINSQVYDIAASSPPEPINIAPDSSNNLKLYLVLHASNTLLVTVKNAAEELLVSASTRLFKTGYDKTILTGETGQSFFTPLESASDYSLKIIKTGYSDFLLENVKVEAQSEITAIMSIGEVSP